MSRSSQLPIPAEAVSQLVLRLWCLCLEELIGACWLQLGILFEWRAGESAGLTRANGVMWRNCVALLLHEQCGYPPTTT